MRRGVLLAIAAALAFGATTPIVAWASRGTFATAALLYGGAAFAAVVLRLIARPNGEALRRSDAPRVALVAIFGAAAGPALLVFGLARIGATDGSLLLNLEAVFTVLLARAVYRETINRRVIAAMTAMVAGGALLVGSLDARWSIVGALAIAGATLCWALDNTLTRPLAEREPLGVVAAKGALGATLTTLAALVAGESLPPLRETLALLACGATGYGLSLRLYLLAQRAIGAARTGSVFALAPFVGAAIAVALGDRALNAPLAGAAALFALGVVLHVTERHRHPHVHPATDHVHPHRHDDDHHDHAHDPPFTGLHTHAHHHTHVEHDHDHAPDAHHD